MIKEFKDDYRFLSNFWLVDVEYEGVYYPSTEHAYQAAKTLNKEERKLILAQPTPGKAKRMGSTSITLRPDWDEQRIPIMTDLTRQKFKNNSILNNLLLSTGNEKIIEGNRWGDTFWGRDLRTNKGQNNLGRIIMQVRDEIKSHPYEGY